MTATNDGNLTITDVVVTDDLTGDRWSVASLAPGQSRSFTTSYTVTSADILAGTVLNVATATGTSPDPEEPDVPVVPGEDPEPTDTPKASMDVVKTVTSTPAARTGYTEGETVVYQITVTNTGNVPYTNVAVRDDLTGASWTIPTLAVGATRTFNTSYQITAADVTAGSVTNVATASADPIEDPKNPGTPIEDPSNPGNPLTPQGDDTVEVPVTDDLAGQYVNLIVHYVYADGSTAAANVSRTYRRGAAYNIASPRITGFTPDQARVRGTITEDTELTVTYRRNTYTLTITYVDQNGNPVAASVVTSLNYGDRYSFGSPTLNGYTASQATVDGTMPARNVQVTVVYTRQDETVTIDDYGTPLGLGNVSLNAGDCFE